MSTAYVYSERYLEHAPRGEHPEHPGRLRAIMATLERYDVLKRMVEAPAVDVADENLERVHTADHIAKVRAIAERGGGKLDADTYVAAPSYKVARLAAGGCVAAVDAVLDGRADNALALVRPPGHHAFAGRGEGFCLFNNVAVAAAHARARGLARVAIVDFDVHHGNGTQAIFYDDPSVLYISTHQSPLYPGTGDWRETGTGKGAGATINVPLPPSVGDTGFAAAWEGVVRPALVRFQPDLLLVSAGFDAHWRDPLAMLQVSVGGFAALAHGLVDLAREVCKGRIVVVLEGGYDLDALGYGTLAVARALLGDTGEVIDPLGQSGWAEESVERLIAGVRRVHELR